MIHRQVGDRDYYYVGGIVTVDIPSGRYKYELHVDTYFIIELLNIEGIAPLKHT